MDFRKLLSYSVPRHLTLMACAWLREWTFCFVLELNAASVSSVLSAAPSPQTGGSGEGRKSWPPANAKCRGDRTNKSWVIKINIALGKNSPRIKLPRPPNTKRWNGRSVGEQSRLGQKSNKKRWSCLFISVRHHKFRSWTFSGEASRNAVMCCTLCNATCCAPFYANVDQFSIHGGWRTEKRSYQSSTVSKIFNVLANSTSWTTTKERTKSIRKRTMTQDVWISREMPIDCHLRPRPRGDQYLMPLYAFIKLLLYPTMRSQTQLQER